MRNTLITVLGVLSLVGLAGCGGGSSSSNRGTSTGAESAAPTTVENPSVSPSPSATAPAAAITIGGVSVTTLTADKNEAFPAGHLFYVLAGCTGCDGPVTGVDRVYKDQAG